MKARTEELPEIHWLPDDDLCDCTYQRIGDWTNPYLGKTLRVRLCCIWNEIYKQYPQFVQEIPAYYDRNRHDWDPQPREWDSDVMAMPVPYWYRLLASQTGKPLEQIRREYDMLKAERPQKVSAAEKRRLQEKYRPTQQEIERANLERLRLGGWLADATEEAMFIGRGAMQEPTKIENEVAEILNPPQAKTRLTLTLAQQVAFKVMAEEKQRTMEAFQLASVQVDALLREFGFDVTKPHNYSLKGNVLEEL